MAAASYPRLDSSTVKSTNKQPRKSVEDNQPWKKEHGRNHCRAKRSRSPQLQEAAAD